MMEESVMKKFISEDSATVTSLCSAVEVCLAQGLKSRVFGLFGRPTSSLALVYQIADMCPPATSILNKVIAAEKQSFADQKYALTKAQPAQQKKCFHSIFSKGYKICSPKNIEESSTEDNFISIINA
uniref:Uncharacterized protein n=1 Tax=Romanomermis culicivorax TaxID=13658 RepID=A0A915HZ81_ROMCU